MDTETVARRPIAGPRALARAAARFEQAPVAQTTGATRMRRGVAVLMALYALVYGGLALSRGQGLSIAAFITLLVACALYANRAARFLRDWVPVFLGLALYVMTEAAVPDLGMKVHYAPQIEIDRLLGLGTLPTTWLQAHLYGGETGPVEIFSLLMYVSHFLAPLMLAFLLWAFWSRSGFKELLFGILAVSILGDITFLLAPTAPPWLAAEQGLIPHVHPIITNALYDLNLDSLAAHKGDPSSYNIVAAIPSLHAAWPVICLFVIRKYHLPRWVLVTQIGITIGVLFAIVYTGEHYLIDALVGFVYAVVAWWLLQLVLGVRSAPQPAESPT